MKIEIAPDKVLQDDIEKCISYLNGPNQTGLSIFASVHKQCCQAELDKRKKLGINIQETKKP